MSENRCVCCGEIIPEGRQCCQKCTKEFMERERKVLYSAVATKKNGALKESCGLLSEVTTWADAEWASGEVVEINIRRIG